MGRPAKGFTALEWDLLSPEAREQIKKDRNREYMNTYMKKYQKEHAAQTAIIRRNTYIRHKEERLQQNHYEFHQKKVLLKDA